MERTYMKRIWSSVLVLSTLIMVFASSAGLAGQAPTGERNAATKHIVSPGDIQASAAAYPAVRGTSIEKIAGFLGTGAVRERLARWGVEPDQVMTAVGSLEASEVAYLEARADDVMARLQGGADPLWLWAGVAAGVVLIICVFILAAERE